MRGFSVIRCTVAASTSSAATFWSIWPAVVAPNSTLRPSGCASANAIASAAGLRRPRPQFERTRRPSSRPPRSGDRRAGVAAAAARRASYLPVSTPPASTNDATTAAPEALERGRHRRVLHPVAAHQAVRQLGRARLASTPELGAASDRLAAAASAGQLTMPQARALPDATRPAWPATRSANDEPVGRRVGVDHVDVVEAHSAERCVELGGRVLLGPELPPQLVGHDDVVAVPAGRTEQLAEQDLGVAGGDRRGAGFVVVAGVVEEGDARARGRRASPRAPSRGGCARTCARSRATAARPSDRTRPAVAAASQNARGQVAPTFQPPPGSGV